MPPRASLGDKYKFLLATEQGALHRVDPYARGVTSSVGNAIVHDTDFDWEGDDFRLALWNELLICEGEGMSELRETEESYRLLFGDENEPIKA
jgi:1,4-alpha-glucan branching enzyme